MGQRLPQKGAFSFLCPRLNFYCLRLLVTTQTSTPQFFTPLTWGNCSAPIIHSSPTINTYPSPITDVLPQLCPAVLQSSVHRVRESVRKKQHLVLALLNYWTTS